MGKPRCYYCDRGRTPLSVNQDPRVREAMGNPPAYKRRRSMEELYETHAPCVRHKGHVHLLTPQEQLNRKVEIHNLRMKDQIAEDIRVSEVVTMIDQLEHPWKCLVEGCWVGKADDIQLEGDDMVCPRCHRINTLRLDREKLADMLETAAKAALPAGSIGSIIEAHAP